MVRKPTYEWAPRRRVAFAAPLLEAARPLSAKLGLAPDLASDPTPAPTPSAGSRRTLTDEEELTESCAQTSQ